MQFSQLSSYVEAIEETASRITITERLAELFAGLTADELHDAVYLLQGRVAPLFGTEDFGMAEKMVAKAVQQAFATDEHLYQQEYRTHGDVGKTAEALALSIASGSQTQQNDLSVCDVYERLYQITQASGQGSQETKITILAQLLAAVTPLGARYVARIPAGAMRLGFSDVTILDAYSWMLSGGKKLRKTIEKAYHVRPDLGFIGKQLKDHGIGSMDQVQPVVGSPILMMRAERMSSGEEIIEKIGECAVEPKYDGFRLQVHYDRATDTVDLYTRGLEHVSHMYPDIVEAVRSEISVDSVIFEGEAIGYDQQTNAFLPFQETVQRKRKHNVAEKAKEIPLKMFVFEILYLNGSSLITQPYTRRRALIEQTIPPGDDLEQATILTAPCTRHTDPKKLEKQFDTAVTEGLEGIIAKKLDGVYQAGARGSNWIKFKRSYATSALDDTLDAVVMGYDYGKGKRAEFGIGAFLVGVFNPDDDRLYTIAKIGTGLTDDEWQELHRRCQPLMTDQIPQQYQVDDHMEVDVWIQPEIVVEIRADEITRSPIHTAGQEAGKSREEAPGYALRFPRLERFRDDKRVEEATTVAEVITLAKRQ